MTVVSAHIEEAPPFPTGLRSTRREGLAGARCTEDWRQKRWYSNCGGSTLETRFLAEQLVVTLLHELWDDLTDAQYLEYPPIWLTKKNPPELPRWV
jgi:hypothetical protein